LEYLLRPTHGLQAKVSFTWSKIISDVDGLDGAQTVNILSPQEEVAGGYLAEDEKGLGSFNQGRNLVANFIYNLPFKGNRLVSGWALGGIGTVADGSPITLYDGLNRAGDDSRNNAIRPNLAPGCSGNPREHPFNVNQYFNPMCFNLQPVGFYGDLSRNTLIAPGFEQFDVTLEKTTAITERTKVLFRAEAFNVGNHPNFGKPNTTLFTTTGLRAPTAGLITSAYNPRQIQFAIKLLF
jgi:hypothetical protein